MQKNEKDMPPGERDFLAGYDPGAYPRPSVTVDIVILTIQPGQSPKGRRPSVLLIRRGGYPDKGKWALPGGFLTAGRESADEAALRELEEETGIGNACLRQLYTFSRPDRDPRTHVLSVAYTALIPYSELTYRAGDDAADAALFEIHSYDPGAGTFLLRNPNHGCVRPGDMAFDHAEILDTALRRLRGRISYEPDAFALLEDRKAFTLHELQEIFEAILGQSLDPSNFRKMLRNSYIATGLVRPTGQSARRKGRRPAALYAFNDLRNGGD